MRGQYHSTVPLLQHDTELDLGHQYARRTGRRSDRQSMSKMRKPKPDNLLQPPEYPSNSQAAHWTKRVPSRHELNHLKRKRGNL